MATVKKIDVLRVLDDIDEDRFCSYWKDIKAGIPIDTQSRIIDITDFWCYLREDKIMHGTIPLDNNSMLEIVAMGHGKTTILLIGGFGNIASQWLYQMKAWSEEYNLIIMHPPGTGHSKLAGQYSIHNISNKFIEALEVLGIQWPIHIVSCSWGGMIGQTIASRFSKRVYSLTLVCSFYEFVSSQGELSVSEKVRLDFNNIGENAYYRFELDCELINILEIKRYAENPESQVNTIHELAHITVPTLVISGKQDCVINPSQSIELYSKIDNAKLWEIDEAGHFPNITHATIFNKGVLSFINHVDS